METQFAHIAHIKKSIYRSKDGKTFKCSSMQVNRLNAQKLGPCENSNIPLQKWYINNYSSKKKELAP